MVETGRKNAGRNPSHCGEKMSFIVDITMIFYSVIYSSNCIFQPFYSYSPFRYTCDIKIQPLPTHLVDQTCSSISMSEWIDHYILSAHFLFINKMYSKKNHYKREIERERERERERESSNKITPLNRIKYASPPRI